MFNCQQDASECFQLSAERAIDASAEGAVDSLQAALGSVDAWQAEWLPCGQRVLLEVTLAGLRVIGDSINRVAHIPKSASKVSLFEAWLGSARMSEASTFLLADVMSIDGQDVRHETLSVRRRLLEEIVRGGGLEFAKCAPPVLVDIVRAPSWRTLSVAHRQAPQHGAAGLVLRFREGSYGAKPLVRWQNRATGAAGDMK